MKAERFLKELLSGLPLRRAPATLEFRVRRELDRRLARPWWSRAFSQWPTGARAFFIAICGAIIGFTVRDSAWTMVARALRDAATPPMSWSHATVAATTSACEVAVLLVRAIPATWIYGGLTAGAVLYAALFGLSAAAYRTLYLQPSQAGDRQ
jgi:hypothetical protein